MTKKLFKDLSLNEQEKIRNDNLAFRDKYLTEMHRQKRAKYEMEFAIWAAINYKYTTFIVNNTK